MTSVLERYQRSSRRRYRRAAQKHQRLDIQGLRMVAVLTVFADHLCGWPRGGFVGVDVFFVISGFLITGNLLRTAETTGQVSFRKFYWNRIRRIVPAATLVLILVCGAAVLVFLPFRAREVGVDALFAFFFASNWWFSYNNTDYFRAAADTVSPVQHYWSLSIEEQFYFVWPALIFLISVLVLRKAWTHQRRMVLAGAVMGVIVAGSLGWALLETATFPTAAYFNTFSRVWELGVGALLASAIGMLARIPARARPFLSWAGLGLIAASLYFIGADSPAFPAPWALLPVAGAALVIAAGVGVEPRFQAFLRNAASTYIGDISYSLYLVHWPVIVFAGALMDPSPYYYLTVVALAFGLAIASYHFVENPLRRADTTKLRAAIQSIRARVFLPEKRTQYAAVATSCLLLIATVSYVVRPDALVTPTAPPAVAAANEVGPIAPTRKLGPLQAALQNEINTALQAKAWPELQPPMATVVETSSVDPAIRPCVTDTSTVDVAECTYGSPSAPTRIILAGDSEGDSYAGPLRQIALNSGGQVQLLKMSMSGCAFTAEMVSRGANTPANCQARNQHVIDTINTLKPNIVIVANLYRLSVVAGGSAKRMSPNDWSTSMRHIIDKFRASAGKIVFLSGPPGEVNIKECFAKRSNVPAECIGRVDQEWADMANVERQLANSIDGKWIDSRPWFCSVAEQCPSFAAGTPTKSDEFHLAPTYGTRIYPVIAESLKVAGVLA